MTESMSNESGNSKVRSLRADPASGDPNPAEPGSGQKGSHRLMRWFPGSWPVWSVSGLLVLLLVLGILYQGTSLAPLAITQKLETLAALRVNLIKSVESEKRAVMADTDEASIAYAEESRQASDAAEAAREQLAELIRLHPSPDEENLLREFDIDWEQLRKLDQQILELAVQNTNLKAARISFGPARETLHRFQAAVAELAGGNDDIRVLRLASEALVAILTIQTLHAPHIASPDDGEMSGIERIIQEKEAVIRRCLDRLAPAIMPAIKPGTLLRAAEAFGEYAELTRTVIELSRQNTNVTSFEISMSRKLKMTAQCELTLGKLQEAIKGREFRATR